MLAEKLFNFENIITKITKRAVKRCLKSGSVFSRFNEKLVTFLPAEWR
jgi:hypothetical protein